MLKSIQVTLLVLYMQVGCIAPSEHCGRSLTERVTYDEPLLQGDTKDDVVVSSVDENGSVTVLVYSQQKKKGEQEIESSYYCSDNGGMSWYRADRLRSLNVDQLLMQQVFTWNSHPLASKLRYRHFSVYDVSAPRRRMVIQRSTDGGMIWDDVRARIRESDSRLDVIEEHYYHPRRSSVLYIVGQAEALGRAGFGLYLSEDRGETFQMVLRRERDGTRMNLAFDQQNPDVMYAVASRGILVKSVDGGKAWRPVPQSEAIAEPYLAKAVGGNGAERVQHRWNSIKDILVDPMEGSTVYVVTEKGLLKTSDSGNSWRVLPLLDRNPNAINNLRMVPRDRDCLYAGTRLGLYKSVNQGCTWKRVDLHNVIKPKE